MTPQPWAPSPAGRAPSGDWLPNCTELKLPVIRTGPGSAHGLASDLLSSAGHAVVTGHDNGIITVDLAEGDDVHREAMRVNMDEPYRTLLGHFRHEIGHYHFFRLVEPHRTFRRHSANCSAIRMSTTRRPSIGTTSRGRLAAGSNATYPPMPQCIPPRTGPRRSHTICTSQHTGYRRRPRAGAGYRDLPA